MISSVYPHKKVSCCPHIPNSNPKFHFWTSVFLHFFLLFFYFASAAGGVSHHAFDRGRRRAAEARACWVLWSGAGWSRGHQGADGAPRGLGQGRRRFRGVVDVLFLFFPVQSTFFLGSLLCFNAWNFRNTGGNWMSYCNMSSPRFFGKLFGDWSDRHGDTSMIFIAACLEWI